MEAAKNNGLDPTLIATVIYYESKSDPDVISQSNKSLGIKGGAVGLMQVMPRDGEAAEIMCANGPCFASRPTIEELKNPEFNIEFGSKMLSGLINKFGLREGLTEYGPEYYATYADEILVLYDQITK